jgi:hypothetical protein
MSNDAWVIFVDECSFHYQTMLTTTFAAKCPHTSVPSWRMHRASVLVLAAISKERGLEALWLRENDFI